MSERISNFPQGHRARKQQGQGSNPGVCSSHCLPPGTAPAHLRSNTQEPEVGADTWVPW